MIVYTTKPFLRKPPMNYHFALCYFFSFRNIKEIQIVLNVFFFFLQASVFLRDKVVLDYLGSNYNLDPNAFLVKPHLPLWLIISLARTGIANIKISGDK